jgi:hypothetical protein
VGKRLLPIQTAKNRISKYDSFLELLMLILARARYQRFNNMVKYLKKSSDFTEVAAKEVVNSTILPIYLKLQQSITLMKEYRFHHLAVKNL